MRGVDVVYYGNPQKLEHDLIVAPGADASAIHDFQLRRGIRQRSVSGGDVSNAV